MTAKKRRKLTQRQMYKQAIWLRLDGEAPRLGSGLRPLYVASVGPKWVRVIAPSDGTAHRFPRRVWDALLKARNNRAAA